MNRLAALLLIAACGQSTGPARSESPVAEQVEPEQPVEPQQEAPSRAAEASAMEGASVSPARSEPAGQDEEITPDPGSVLIVSLASDAQEILGSEQRLVDRLAGAIGRLDREVEARSDAVANSQTLFGPGASPPEEWEAETAILLLFASSRELRSGRRASRGVRGLGVYSGSPRRAVFTALHAPDQVAWGVGDDTLEDFVVDLVRDLPEAMHDSETQPSERDTP